jgi:hypothetical protein
MNERRPAVFLEDEAFRAAADEMEEVLKEEGFDDHGTHAVFVRWQRQTIAQLTGMLTSAQQTIIGRVEELCERAEAYSKLGEAEITKLRALQTGAQTIMDLAYDAVKTAEQAQNHTIAKTDEAISEFAASMGTKILSSSQNWLVLRQTDHNRRFAFKVGLVMSALALMLFISGFQVRAWQDAPATEALSRCVGANIWIQIPGKDRPSMACVLDELAPRELTGLSRSIRDLVTGWFG